MRAERLDTALEKLLGPLVSEALAGTYGTDEDPLLAPWVRRIGSEVAAFSPRDDLKPRFSLLASDVANAVALPGGQIYVFRGLLDTISSDDELAGVLAHESAHVARRHALKHLGENGAALALLSLLRSRELRLVGTVLNILRGLSRSRDLEAEADALGLGMAAAAGYDPRGLEVFLQGIAGDRISKLEEQLMTHPTPGKRLIACRKSPLTQRPSLEDREALAAALERRGLTQSAARTRSGGDPLALPPLPIRPAPPGNLARERSVVVQQASDSLRALAGAWKAQKVGGVLQQLLLLNSQADDWRWLVLAARAYRVFLRVGDVYARSVRVHQLAPGVWDGLVRPSVPDIEGVLGREETLEALRRAEAGRVPLTRAARTVLGVLGDLNLRLWRLGKREQWLRYGLLEGLVRQAESELARADERSGQGWRLLARARIRRYVARLDELGAPGKASEPIWAARLEARIGSGPERGGESAGQVSLRRMLALQSGQSERDMADLARREGWLAAAERVGVVENLATALRLLTLEVEREAQV